MVFYNSLSHLKPMSHFFPILLNILEPLSCVRNLPPPKKKKKKKKEKTNKEKPYNIIN